MKNAGSALMGIGRASGDNRALQAAQQSIESPLLEVSIDGARGILFNVIGGHDLSMHEINSAAETITAAADPDANIIFGATISPDLEGEVIVTVVATGFDASYFANRNEENSHKAASTETASSPAVNKVNDESVASDLDMELEDASSNPAQDFTSDEPIPNIWTIDDQESESHDGAPESQENAIISSELDKDIEKPSFLRRLAKRHNKDESKDEAQEKAEKDTTDKK
jgi:cell division protein FtsZ